MISLNQYNNVFPIYYQQLENIRVFETYVAVGTIESSLCSEDVTNYIWKHFSFNSNECTDKTIGNISIDVAANALKGISHP